MTDRWKTRKIKQGKGSDLTDGQDKCFGVRNSVHEVHSDAHLSPDLLRQNALIMVFGERHAICCLPRNRFLSMFVQTSATVLSSLLGKQTGWLIFKQK